MEFMAPPEHRAMLRNQRERPLLPAKPGAFLDPDLRPLGGAAEGGEGGQFRPEAQRIVAPMAGRDHPAIKVEDALKLGAVEGGDLMPVPGRRERRDDAHALLAFGAA